MDSGSRSGMTSLSPLTPGRSGVGLDPGSYQTVTPDHDPGSYQTVTPGLTRGPVKNMDSGSWSGMAGADFRQVKATHEDETLDFEAKKPAYEKFISDWPDDTTYTPKVKSCSRKGGTGQDGACRPRELKGEVFWYWSSSAVAGYDSTTWFVDFYGGRIVNVPVSRINYVGGMRVRCVR